MLLPRSKELEEEEEDPRASLIRRLQEYERFKQAAEDMDVLPRLERDTWVAKIKPPDLKKDRPLPELRFEDRARGGPPTPSIAGYRQSGPRNPENSS